VVEKTGQPSVDTGLGELAGALARIGMAALTVLKWIALAAVVFIAVLAAAGALPLEAAAAACVAVIAFAITMISSGAASASTVMKSMLGRAPPGA
jgi:hypothetical protein